MRILYSALAVALLVFGVYQLLDSLKSPEEVIIEKLTDAVEGFNETRLAPVMDLFTPDFVESNRGYTREMIKSGVIAAFFREVDPTTKKFLFRVSLLEVEVTLAEDATSASASFRADLEKLRRGAWQVEWAFEFDGELLLTEFDSWQFKRGQVETVEGSRPR